MARFEFLEARFGGGLKRFADSIAREKGVKPPPGYATSGSICRAFLNQHAPKKADAGIPGASGSKPASPAQMLFAEKLAQEKGIVIPDEAKATSAAISTWIDSNQVKKSDKSRRKRVNTPTKSIAPKSAVQKRDLGKARQMSLPQLLRQRRLGRIREPIPHCGFPTATRMPP